MEKILYPRLFAAGLAVVSLTASRAQPVIEPQLDVPLRDAAVVRGPGGAYYLTGTTATENAGGEPNFDHNRGLRVWQSSDLEDWQDLGFVWDLWKDPNPRAHGVATWQNEMMPVPGLEPGDRVRGMTAPRLTFTGDRWLVSFSMNGYGAGLIRSETAEVDGSYSDLGPFAEAGGAPTGRSDASVFVDGDGTEYLIWNGGVIAKLKDDISHLGKGDVGVTGERRYLPALIEGYPGDVGLPQHGAPYGVSVYFHQDSYYLLFTATTLRGSTIHEDAFISVASNLFGPYSKPRLLVPDGGRVTAFTGPGGNPMLSYSREDAPVIAGWPTSPPVAEEGIRPAPRPVTIVEAIPSVPPVDPPDDLPLLMEHLDPILTHPLRDAALGFGPDGEAYLMGTEASAGAGRTLDWANNKGIRLWRSSDLENWQDLGYVWEIETDGSDWQKQTHLDLTIGGTPQMGRAVTAPEIHYLKGTFWIVYSMNGQGIGLLRSSTGKAEGPYEDAGRLTHQGRDPSLFEDDDGTVYLVWGQGFYAPLNENMTALAGPVQTLFTDVEWFPRYMRRMEIMGQWGSHLTKSGDWYIWTFTGRTGRCGINSIDTFASWSKSLDGPWEEPCIMLPNGGQSTIAKNPEGVLFATVSGEDEHARAPFLPAITRVASFRANNRPSHTKDGLDLRSGLGKPPGRHFHQINGQELTTVDTWKGFPELIPTTTRDIWMKADPDGYYYLSGSMMDQEYAGQVLLWRSKDKLHWENLGVMAESEQFVGHPDFDVERYEKVKKQSRTGHPAIYDTKFEKARGHYYLHHALSPYGGGLVYKSKGDDIRGPYEPLTLIPHIADLRYYGEEEGFLFALGGNWTTSFEDIETVDMKKVQRHDVVVEGNLDFTEDAEAGILIIDGKYVRYSTDWTGSYDMNYAIADQIEGPWRNLRIGIPYGGNGYLFQDFDESWWYATFPNTNDFATRLPIMARTFILPVAVEWSGDELIIEPKAVQTNRARLEQLGALWQSPRTPGSAE